MKTIKIYLICSLAILLSAINMHVQATVLVVNNISNGPGQYSSVIAAMQAANAGDTLYIDASATNYGSFTITKSLAIIGKGSYADVQYSQPTSCADITIADSVSYVSIEGISLSNIYLGISCHHINIASCYVTGKLNLNINVTYCNFSSSIYTYGAQTVMGQNCNANILYTGMSNLIFQNNIFNGWFVSVTGNNIIQHNLFLVGNEAFKNGVYQCGSTYQNVSNAVVQDNIFYNSNPNNNTTSCIFNNNLTYNSYGGNTSLGGSNINNTDPLFVNAPVANYFSFAYNYHLQAGSPAIGAASDGSDIGIYGGSNTMTTYLEPYGLPMIRKVDVQNFNVPVNGNVNVKVRSTKTRTN